MIKKLTYIELQKIFRKWRSYIGFLAIGGLTLIIQVVFYYNQENYFRFATRGLQDSFLIVGNFFNGYFIANIILQSLFIHIPFLIVLVGGDLLAGEATAGTYRIVLTRPVTRFQLLASKFCAGTIYTTLLVFWMAFLSLGVSLILFGDGDLFNLQDKIYILSGAEVLVRFLYVYLFSIISLTTVLSVSFLLSSLVANAIGPIVGTMAIIIIFLILSALPLEALDFIKPYLFTTYMSDWKGLMIDPINFRAIFESLIVLLAHIVGLFGITYFIFNRKDILT